jgi:hypothetical protein
MVLVPLAVVSAVVITTFGGGGPCASTKAEERISTTDTTANIAIVFLMEPPYARISIMASWTEE